MQTPSSEPPSEGLLARLPLVAIIMGLLLTAPSILTGFYADDYGHQITLRQDIPDSPMKPWSLYDFASHDDWSKIHNPFFEFPFWTADEWSIRFFRPVSSLLLWFQFSLFGDWATGYHLVSLFMFVLVLLSAFRLYRNLGFSLPDAKRATLLFAVCDAASLPVGWIANQNTLCVALSSSLSLYVLSSPRLSWSKLLGGLALACVAVLSKESGGRESLNYGGLFGTALAPEHDESKKALCGRFTSQRRGPCRLGGHHRFGRVRNTLVFLRDTRPRHVTICC